MNCDQIRALVDGHTDRELDPVTSQRIEEHLRGCRDCSEVYRAHEMLARAIVEQAPYHKAPSGLRERIQSSLRNEITGKTGRNAADNSRRRPLTKPAGDERSLARSWNWLALAAALVAGAIIALTVMPRLNAPDASQILATQLIASHARSLMANHLTDVASSDQHTVKPWLDTKLDFAPPVVDLANDGFPLIGGRLDYLDSRPVAALVYQRRKHFINLFVWPASSNTSGAANAISRQGYQLVHWADSDFNYWAVSDVNASDLEIFKQQFQAEKQRH